MDLDRNNDASALATEAGWVYLKEQRVFHTARTLRPQTLPMPATHASLAAHLEFVARLCDFLVTRLDSVERVALRGNVAWTVTIFSVRGCAGDPSHAAVIAAYNLLSGKVPMYPEPKQLEPLRYLVAWAAGDDRTAEEEALAFDMEHRLGVTLPGVIAEARYQIEVADALAAGRKGNDGGEGEA